MNRKKLMSELMNEIQDLNFRRVYGDVSMDEQLSLMQKSNEKKRQLKFLEKKGR